MRKLLIVLLGTILLASAACGNPEDGGDVSVVPTADLSQFPTPSGSRSTPLPTQLPADQVQGESPTANTPPLTQEEFQQLRQRIQSGELSQEEAQELFQQLQEQFGPGDGGRPFGGGGARQTVGAIERIEQDSLTITTEAGIVTVAIGADTQIMVTSVLDTTALSEGAQVVVAVERDLGMTLATTIALVSENQGGFDPFPGVTGAAPGGPGAFGGGQEISGVSALFGSIVSLDESTFTLETRQGPLRITTDQESIVVETSDGTLVDLKTGIQIRIVGPADEAGGIDAITILTIPEGLENVPDLGRGGFGGGRPLGGGP